MATTRRAIDKNAAWTKTRAHFASGFVVWLLAAFPCFNLGGAEPPRASKNPADLGGYDALITAEDRGHWAFQPLTNPCVPDVAQPRWTRNPIDRFVLAGLEEHGWRPSPAAEPRVFLRRLFLDLTGLPPTLVERTAFLEDFGRSPDAVERLVDDLLARPTYGERWGRHWLDLVRYAESNGYERDAAKPFAWRYRDYVIRAFNADMPYDRFLVEQLAGDELPDREISASTLIATGYYRLGPWDDEPADPVQDRFDQLDDLVNTTSEVFLGLTIGCARCHNHKFEPLTMHDYYRMVAIFAPLRRPANGRAELTLPIEAPGPTAAAGADRIQGYFLREPSANPPVTRLLFRGQAATPGPEVGPGVPAVVVKAQPAFPAPAKDSRTSKRRLTLARWLAGPDNGLPARVIVNRVWQHHFGQGLVRTPSDFGTMGEPPTHPELLEWLTTWFVDHACSLKALHRLILTSSTYRMSTQTNLSYAAVDPEDRRLWRMPYRRLDVEVIRDSMLSASGRLDRAMYGPSIYPFVPRQAMAGHSDPDKIWPPFDEATHSRRTIYAFMKRSLIVPMLEVLDFCDTTRSTARRTSTNVPTQALTLLNGDFVNRQSAHLADRLVREAGGDASAQIDRAYLLTVCRRPDQAERDQMLCFLNQESQGRLAEAARSGVALTSDGARRHSLVQLCRALFNMNEFVYTD